MASGVALAAVLAAGQAFAQDAAPAEAPATTVDEVVVTGSSIRGVAPVGSALIGVSRDQVNAVAPTNVKDMLATVPALGNFGANAEQSTPNRFRTAGFIPNIHNLGVYAPLTLLNGHRVAATGTEGTFPDPSTVPTIAIQRTEIIADGASAIYGADAVAGVVNFIYRKPFDGVETTTTYSWDNETRYERKNFGIIGGKTWDGGGVMLAYEYSGSKSPLQTEIPYLALGGDQRSRGGRDLRGTTCLNPTLRGINTNGVPVGTTYAYPNFSTALADRSCGVLSPQTLIPDLDRHGFLLTADHQLTDTVKVWGELNYGHQETESLAGRPALSVNMRPGAAFYNDSTVPAALRGQDVSVIRSGVGLFSTPVTNEASGTVTTAAFGLDIDLGAEWKGTVSLVSSATRDYWESRELDYVNLIAAVNDPNPATALNLFTNAAGNNAATLASIDNGAKQRNWGAQRLQELQFKADGPLFAIPGGDVRAAVGASFRTEQMNQLQTGGVDAPGSGFYQIVRDDHLNRSVQAVFTEVNVPLISDLNEKPWAKALTLSISGRYDHFDSYGGQFNPKYGIVYKPIEDLSFHASYGTNFSAPSLGIMGSLFAQPQYNTNPNVVIGYGQYKGTTLTNINQYTVSGGNPDLQPEEATTKSFGFTYTPSFLEGLRVGINWYQVDYTNLIFKITGADLIQNEAFSKYAEFYPTPARMAEIIAQIAPSSPITVETFQYVPYTQAVNLGTREFEGLDYDISYRLNTDSFGVFNFGISANQQLRLDQQVLPGQPVQNRLDTVDAVKWKTRYSVGWNLDPITVNMFVNYTSGFKNITVTPFQNVDSYTTVDLTAAYEFKNLAKGVVLQGRVANLFDKDPPFYDSANGYYPNLASPFPRSFDVTVRAKF